jgi:hypothetical protein
MRKHIMLSMLCVMHCGWRSSVTQAAGDAESLLYVTQRQAAAVRGELPTVEVGDDGLADDR